MFRTVADEYAERLGRYGSFGEIEVREAGKAPTAAEALRQEGERLRAKVESGTWLVALDREGTPWSSEALAKKLNQWRESSRSVILLVGGSHGIDPSLIHDCRERWSLGPATLPHELARVVALEQLYRAWTIVRGEPYHK